MARETFLSATLHPAYENCLMPAEDAGTATAYLIAKLTGEYHAVGFAIPTVIMT